MEWFSKLIASITIFISSLLSPSAPLPTTTPSALPTITISVSPASTPTIIPTKPQAIATIKPTGRAPLAPVPCEGRDGGDCAKITPQPTATTSSLYDTRYKNVTITIKLKTTPFCSQNTPKTIEIYSSRPEYKIFQNDTTNTMYQTTSGDTVTFSGLYSGFYKFVIKYCTDKQMTLSVDDDENMLPGKTFVKTVELLESPSANVWYKWQ